MTSRDEADEAAQLRAFSQKREALERLVLLARSLSTLGEGIESVIALQEQARKAVPGKVFFGSLAKRLETQSPESIVAQHDSLVQKLNGDLENIVTLARATEDTIAATVRELNVAQEKSDLDFLEHYLDEFQRRVQLVVALRLYMDQKLIAAPGVELAVSVQDLEAELAAVRERESACRTRVRATVQELISDADQILASGNYPDSLCEQVRAMREGLLESLEHIDAGKDIAALPVLVEEMEIDVPAYGAYEEVAAPSKPSSEPEATPGAGADDAPPAPASAMPAATPTEADVDQSAGFLATLWTWLNTPRDVDWVEARRRAARGSKPKR